MILFHFLIIRLDYIDRSQNYIFDKHIYTFIGLYIWGTRRVSYKKQELPGFWWSPCCSFFSCPIMCLYVLSSVCFVVICAYLCSTQNMLCFVLFFFVYVASFSELFFLIAPSVFSNVYLSCVLCTLCCQFLWIVLFDCPFGIL